MIDESTKFAWSTKTFAELAEFSNGLNFTSSTSGVPVRLLGVRDFQQDSTTNLQSLDTVHIERVLRSREILQEGDLVFVRSNGNRELVGRCLLITRSSETATHSGFTIRARFTSDCVRPAFVNALVRTSFIRRLMLTDGTGTNINNLNQRILGSLPIPVPSIEEQDTILAFLANWDRAIEHATRVLDLKERRKRALMQQLLAGQKRFPKFIDSNRMVQTRFGARPEDWPLLHVGDIANESGARNGVGGELPVLSCTKHRGLVLSLEYFGKQVYSKDTSNYKVVQRNEFAYATNHIEEGSIGLLDFEDAGLVSPMYTVFRTNDRVDTKFLYALFKTELYRHIFEVHTNSSVNRRGSLRWNEFRKLPIALPSLEEQKKIAEVLTACDDEITILESELDAIQRQKRGLMQQLLTGRIRIAAEG